MNDKNKSLGISILSIIMIVVSLLFIVFGITSYLSNSKEKVKEKAKDNPSVDKKDEESTGKKISYKGYVYTLPKGWERNEEYTKALNIFFKYYEDDHVNQMGSIIDIKKLSSSDVTIESIFKDLTYFENMLKNNNNFNNVGEGKLVTNEDTTAIFFPCEYGDSQKVIMVYMPAYDDYYYNVQFYYNKIIDDKPVSYHNLESAYIIVDFLNTGVKE